MDGINSVVEKKVIESSNFKLRYEPEEKIGVLVVDSFPELGKITALRFIEWLQNNPGGVVSLPTGKTPEYFIKETMRFLHNWEEKDVKKELEEWGLDLSRKPDMRSYYFVQIDEFYPIDPQQHNSFYYYVYKFYINGFGFDRRKSLLINCEEIGMNGQRIEEVWPEGEVDLSLRYRKPSNKLEMLQKEVLERVDEWCNRYEERIRSLGGIGFFLGGIGPDGHIGFNIRGSNHFSTTRLMPVNYETQAASAQDLGGIEIARKRLVITIGLATITYNPECVAIIMAAGEAKSKIVAGSITSEKSIQYPASALQSLRNARFYLTRGAAIRLVSRNIHLIKKTDGLDDRLIEKILIDTALKKLKPIKNLTKKDILENKYGKELLPKSIDIEKLKEKVEKTLISKIEKGRIVRKNVTFLHTEPHHDDIMLGYLPAVVRHIREHSTKHFFVTFTSGFTAVTNTFMLENLLLLDRYLRKSAFDELIKDGYFDPNNIVGKNRDVWQYLDGVAANSRSMCNEGRARRLLRNLIFLYEETDIQRLRDRIKELINYFETQYPGRKDLPHIQRLKGMCREYEGDCLWGYFGWHSDSIFHLRLGFYTGDIFNEEPTVERDVLPILEVLRKVNPDIISVALDPEGSGPDTHYKVLQAFAEALKRYEKESGRKNIEIWGYRNVWYRFHPSEANMFVPVSLNMLSLQDSAFKNSFLSQKDASFPSWEHDGPFSELAQKIQVEQYQMLKTCLGRKFFYEHESALIRATRGLVFIKSMSQEELYSHCRELRKITENI